MRFGMWLRPSDSISQAQNACKPSRHAPEPGRTVPPRSCRLNHFLQGLLVPFDPDGHHPFAPHLDRSLADKQFDGSESDLCLRVNSMADADQGLSELFFQLDRATAGGSQLFDDPHLPYVLRRTVSHGLPPWTHFREATKARNHLWRCTLFED